MCRSPHGERGLKFNVFRYTWVVCYASLSSRRAWIEILYHVGEAEQLESLSSRRAWIEIKCWFRSKMVLCCRSPHGERGLKLNALVNRIGRVIVALLTESVD